MFGEASAVNNACDSVAATVIGDGETVSFTLSLVAIVAPATAAQSRSTTVAKLDPSNDWSETGALSRRPAMPYGAITGDLRRVLPIRPPVTRLYLLTSPG